MNAEQLRKMHGARPFRPLTLHLADGREIGIDHPEFLTTSPQGRTAIVFFPDDTFEAVDVLMITSIHVSNGIQRRRKRS